MELDKETVEALGCRSSWDVWEIAAMVRISQERANEAQRPRSAWYRAKHRRRVLASKKAYYQANIERERAKRREHERRRREINREAANARMRVWRAARRARENVEMTAPANAFPSAKCPA